MHNYARLPCVHKSKSLEIKVPVVGLATQGRTLDHIMAFELSPCSQKSVLILMFEINFIVSEISLHNSLLNIGSDILRTHQAG